MTRCPTCAPGEPCMVCVLAGRRPTAEFCDCGARRGRVPCSTCAKLDEAGDELPAPPLGQRVDTAAICYMRGLPPPVDLDAAALAARGRR